MEKKKGKDDVPFFYKGRKTATKSRDFQGENYPDLTTGEQIAELPDIPNKVISEHPIPTQGEWIPKCVEIHKGGIMELGGDACTSRTPKTRKTPSRHEQPSMRRGKKTNSKLSMSTLNCALLLLIFFSFFLISLSSYSL